MNAAAVSTVWEGKQSIPALPSHFLSYLSKEEQLQSHAQPPAPPGPILLIPA